MDPVVFTKRAHIPGGLWTPKLYGEFVEGDPSKAKHYFVGKAEIKQYAGNMKLFFTDVKLINRTDYPSVHNNEDHKRIQPSLTVKNHLEKKKLTQIPKLYAYLSLKRPKTRMIDIHKVGTRLLLNNDIDGLFGKESTIGTFEASLRDIPNVMGFRGLVIVKIPSDDPITEEPIVYSFLKFEFSKMLKLKTNHGLKLSEIEDMMIKSIVDKNDATHDTDIKKEEFSATQKKINISSIIKSLDTYRRASVKIWETFEKSEYQKVDFTEFLQMLEYLHLYLVESQSLRLFHAMDTLKESLIGMSEFENFLMAYDCIGPVSNIPFLDVFDTLKVTQVEPQPPSQPKNQQQQKQPSNTQMHTVGPFVSVNLTGNQMKSIAITANTSDGNVSTDVGPKLIEGLDFSGFCEAASMVGLQENENTLMTTFCEVTKSSSSTVGSTLMTLEQLKRGWIKHANIEAEMIKRGFPPDRSIVGQQRNKERLLRYINTTEINYLYHISTINGLIEDIKQKRRQKKDQQRIEKQAFRDKLIRDASLFTAVRSQEKRILLKKEQEERSKKRIEEKLLRNQLLLQQQENKLRKQEELNEERKKRERLRLDEIRALGYDRMNFNSKEWRLIPPLYYNTPDAKTLLSYVILLDLSNNMLECLPESDFFFSLASVRNIKCSQNRLRTIPSELCDIKCLEILELDSNHISCIPNNFGSLTSLKKLNISNNQLVQLPTSISNCVSLKHIVLHSNNMIQLPTSIGHCLSIESIDISRNQFVELPEDFQYFNNLVYLDVSTNRLSHFPHYIGNCSKLSYLDASTNLLTFLPDSFSSLSQLEYCNLDRNQITSKPNVFSGMTSLKDLHLNQNQFSELFSDFGECRSLNRALFSYNRIKSLPKEIGLLKHLLELNLTGNRLTTLPAELGACQSLQMLILTDNKITGSLPEKIGLFGSLRVLDISNNQIDSIPKSIIGLSDLHQLLAYGNKLDKLPDTLTNLLNLQKVDIGNNLMSRFPIELVQLPSLTTLSLRQNRIALLPKNINVFSTLDHLDLTGNVLRALPVEFAEVLESVPEVLLESNPWTDLPPIWNKIWRPTNAIDCPNGYSLSDAVEFMYSMRTIYNTAEVIWQESGAFHYQNRLGLRDFLLELEVKLPRSWHAGLEDLAKFIYFKAKEYGIFPKWYAIDETAKEEQQLRMLSDEKRRDLQVIKAKEEMEAKSNNLINIYERDVRRRAQRKEELHAELAMNEETLNSSTLNDLYITVQKQQITNTSRVVSVSSNQQEKIDDEIKRLLEISRSASEPRRLLALKKMKKSTRR